MPPIKRSHRRRRGAGEAFNARKELAKRGETPSAKKPPDLTKTAKLAAIASTKTLDTPKPPGAIFTPTRSIPRPSLATRLTPRRTSRLSGFFYAQRTASLSVSAGRAGRPSGLPGSWSRFANPVRFRPRLATGSGNSTASKIGGHHG